MHPWCSGNLAAAGNWGCSWGLAGLGYFVRFMFTGSALSDLIWCLSSTLGESTGPVVQNVCVCVFECLSVCLSPISRPLIGRKYRGGGYWGGWACRGPQICCSIKQRKGCTELCHTQIFSLANLWKSIFFWFDWVLPHSDMPPPPNFFLPPIKNLFSSYCTQPWTYSALRYFF